MIETCVTGTTLADLAWPHCQMNQDSIQSVRQKSGQGQAKDQLTGSQAANARYQDVDRGKIYNELKA